MEKQKLAQKQREIERLKKTVEKLNQVIAERNDRIAELEVLPELTLPVRRNDEDLSF